MAEQERRRTMQRLLRHHLTHADEPTPLDGGDDMSDEAQQGLGPGDHDDYMQHQEPTE
jgi:hypothetical protein